MPDRRKHRGPHPEDERRFAAEWLPCLREATSDVCWLLSRGYAARSTLKIVGDRYALDARQRLAVARCASSDEAVHRRRATQLSAQELGDQILWIDGYNVLTSIEAALSGGILLHARDGCYRDLASMHGSYRKVAETNPAVRLIGDMLAQLNLKECRWLLDQPVSNSGRLKQSIAEIADQSHWSWQIELVQNPDRVLVESKRMVATADSVILDRVDHWFNLARFAVQSRAPDAWVVEL